MSKKDSSRRWLDEHFSDIYVKQAQEMGYRSRAVFKLIEINKRDHLFKPGMLIIDLGAAPGGWCQLVVNLVKPKGRVIALDLLPMDPITGVEFIQGDFLEPEVEKKLQLCLDDQKPDWVLSDMAPNMSGNEIIDIPRAMNLAETAFYFAAQVLKPGGGLVMKVFQGEGFDQLLGQLKQAFKSVAIRKPKASRNRSREVYLVAKGFLNDHFPKTSY